MLMIKYTFFYCFSFVEVDQSTSYGKSEHVVPLALVKSQLNHKTSLVNVCVNVNIYRNLSLPFIPVRNSQVKYFVLQGVLPRKMKIFFLFFPQFGLVTALACVKYPWPTL